MRATDEACRDCFNNPRVEKSDDGKYETWFYFCRKCGCIARVQTYEKKG